MWLCILCLHFLSDGVKFDRFQDYERLSYNLLIRAQARQKGLEKMVMIMGRYKWGEKKLLVLKVYLNWPGMNCSSTAVKQTIRVFALCTVIDEYSAT